MGSVPLVDFDPTRSVPLVDFDPTGSVPLVDSAPTGSVPLVGLSKYCIEKCEFSTIFPLQVFLKVVG